MANSPTPVPVKPSSSPAPAPEVVPPTDLSVGTGNVGTWLEDMRPKPKDPPAPAPEPTPAPEPQPAPAPDPTPAPEPTPPKDKPTNPPEPEPAPAPFEAPIPPSLIDPPEPAPAPEPEEDPDPDLKLNPETGEPWKSTTDNIKALVKIKQDLTAKRKDLESQLTTATQELETLKANPPAPEGTVLQSQFDELQTELNKALDQVAQLDLEKDPRFHKEFQTKLEPVLTTARMTAQALGLDDELFTSAANMTTEDRIAFLKNKSPDNWQMIAQTFIPVDQIYMERAQALEQFKLTRAKLDASQVNNSNLDAKDQAEFNSRVLAQAVTQHAKDGFEVFIEVPDNEEWNNQVKTVKDTAAKIISDGTPETMIHAAALAAAAPLYKQMYHVVYKEAQRLAGELAKIQENRPGNKSRSPSSGPAPKPGDDKGKKNRAQNLSERVFVNREFQGKEVPGQAPAGMGRR